MIRFLAALLCAVFLAGSAAAQLPEDGSRMQLIVVTAETPSPVGQYLLSCLDTDPAVSLIAQKCHVHRWTPQTKIYQERYGQSLPPSVLPIIALARPDGGVIYKASGDAVPRTSEALAAGLIDAAKLNKAGGHENVITQDCPSCPRVPQPPPVPELPRRPIWRPLDGVIPDTVVIDHKVPAVPTWIMVTAIAGFVFMVLGGLTFIAIAGVFAFLKFRG